jgi:hypothetical protein
MVDQVPFHLVQDLVAPAGAVQPFDHCAEQGVAENVLSVCTGMAVAARLPDERLFARISRLL